MKMNHFRQLALFFSLFLMVGVVAYAQITLPGDGDPSGPVDTVPINTLLALGLAIGGALGIRKTLKKK